MTNSNREYEGIPLAAIPPTGTAVRQMLDLYMAGQEVPEQLLCDQFGRNFRSILQRLSGDRFKHWRFIDVLENGVIEARYLDHRHLSQDYHLDELARAERRKELKADSHKEAMQGACRVQKAFEEYQEAEEELATLQKENALPKQSV